LKGNFAARASVPASFAVAASLTAVALGRCDGLLTVLRAELRVGPEAAELFWIFFGCGCARVPACFTGALFLRVAIGDALGKKTKLDPTNRA